MEGHPLIEQFARVRRPTEAADRVVEELVEDEERVLFVNVVCEMAASLLFSQDITLPAEDMEVNLVEVMATEHDEDAITTEDLREREENRQPFSTPSPLLKHRSGNSGRAESDEKEQFVSSATPEPGEMKEEWEDENCCPNTKHRLVMTTVLSVVITASLACVASEEIEMVPEDLDREASRRLSRVSSSSMTEAPSTTRRDSKSAVT